MDRSQPTQPAPAGQGKVRLIGSKVVNARCRELANAISGVRILANRGDLTAAKAGLAAVSVAADELAGMIDAYDTPAPATLL